MTGQGTIGPRGAYAQLTWEFLMFLFFSNKLGCFGSLLISAVITIVVLSLLGMIKLGTGW